MTVGNRHGAWWRRASGRLVFVLVCGVCVMSVRAARESQGTNPASAKDLYQQAAHQEDAVGNVEAAIALYRRALAAKPDREIAARAQLRIGLCLEKLGRPEARQSFETVVRDYADQGAVAGQARARLTALTAAEPPRPPGTGVEATLLWAGVSVDQFATISPDGRYLAFQDYTAGDRLAIKDLRTGERRLITGNDGNDVFGPVFSPDGGRVAYGAYGKDRSLRVVNRDGSDMRVLSAGGTIDFPYAWSADGRLIALNLYDSGQSRIAVASVDNGSITPLKSTGWQKADVGGFSSDGKFLVYSLSATTSAPDDGVFLLAVDGGSHTKIADGKAPGFTPDGRAVVFVSNRSGTNDLWVVPVTAGQRTGPPELLRQNIGDINNLGFTRDGSFFYVTKDLRNDVLVARLDSESWHVDEPRVLNEASVGANVGASWSPDGRRVAFFRGNDRQAVTLVVRTVATGNERALPSTFAAVAFQQDLPWFPDGRSLLMNEPASSRRVFKRIDIETGAQQVILDNPFGSAGIWFDLSPDGRSLYYLHRGDEDAAGGRIIRLIKRDLQTTNEVELIRSTDSAPFRFSVSPDGTQVAVKPVTKPVLLLLPTAGGPPVEVYRGDASDPVPVPLAWTRDGRYILGAGPAGGDDERDHLWAIPASGGAPVKLAFTSNKVVALSVSPADGSVLISVRRPNNELWVARNLLSQPRPK